MHTRGCAQAAAAEAESRGPSRRTGAHSRDWASAEKELGDYHFGAVISVVVLPHTSASETLFATAGADGTFRVWDYARRRLLCKRVFTNAGGNISDAVAAPARGVAAAAADAGIPTDASPAVITCMTAHKELPLLAIGAADGRVRFVWISREGSSRALATVLHREWMHDGAVTGLVFARFAPVAVSFSHVDRKAFVIDVRVPALPDAPPTVRGGPAIAPPPHGGALSQVGPKISACGGFRVPVDVF